MKQIKREIIKRLYKIDSADSYYLKVLKIMQQRIIYIWQKYSNAKNWGILELNDIMMLK